jgi:AraC-like DNA-binding protein
VASRYSRLIASPFAVTLESHGRKSVLRFDDDVPWSAVSADFAVSGWYRAHAADELPRGAHPECWFPYAAPRDTAEHERTFPNAVLKFGAPFLGIVFEQSHVTAPMTVGDPVVHTMLCARADSLLSELRHSESLTRIVRSLIAESLRDGDVPSVEQVARRLHMSHRTVSRRLEREGTNFATELDDKRRELALTLVQQASLPLSGVAFRVGFSHTESFFRAFKRWTGTTPQTYRARPPAPPVT